MKHDDIAGLSNPSFIVVNGVKYVPKDDEAATWYRKKPVAIRCKEAHHYIVTLEETMRIDFALYSTNDPIVDICPCKPDIFSSTYEPIFDTQPPQPDQSGAIEDGCGTPSSEAPYVGDDGA